MKWSEEKVNQLKKLAFAGMPNAQIAKTLSVGVSDVYAKRSQLGITIDKVRVAAKAGIPQQSGEKHDFLKSLEATICKADPSIKSLSLIDQGRLVCIAYADGTRRYAKIRDASLLAIVVSVARVCLK